MTSSLIVTRKVGLTPLVSWFLGKCTLTMQGARSLTVMATDANRLKRLLEPIGRNDPVPGPL